MFRNTVNNFKKSTENIKSKNTGLVKKKKNKTIV